MTVLVFCAKVGLDFSRVQKTSEKSANQQPSEESANHQPQEQTANQEPSTAPRSPQICRRFEALNKRPKRQKKIYSYYSATAYRYDRRRNKERN